MNKAASQKRDRKKDKIEIKSVLSNKSLSPKKKVSPSSNVKEASKGKKARFVSPSSLAKSHNAQEKVNNPSSPQASSSLHKAGNENSNHSTSPNLIDVARYAGVSRSTASLVLRKSPLVAENTRQKVQNAMKELGYVYNRSAAMLREGKTRIASLLLCDLGNPSIAHVISGFDRFLQKENYFSILSGSNDSAAMQKYILQRMKEHNIDGIALCPALKTPSRFMYELSQSGLPIVQLLRRLPDYEADYVGADYGQGVRLAIEHLIKLGHTKIAFLGGEGDSSALHERYDSFRTVMKSYNLSENIIQATALKNGAGAEGMKHLLARNPHLTAVICFNDIIALDAMHFLLSEGKMPGRDFSIIGVDNFSVASSVWPALTTVSTRSSDVGEEAARLLLRRIASPQARIEQVVLPVKLIVRQSTGPAPSSL